MLRQAMSGLKIKSGAILSDSSALFPGAGEDAGNALRSLNEIGWKVPITGNYTFTFADTIMKVAGP
jgi:hypothetical protein